MNRWSSRLRSVLRRKREIVCSARLEWQNSNERGKSHHDDAYVGDYPLAELRRDVEWTISEQLPADLSEIFGIDAEVRIIETRAGSLTVFFSVLLAGLAAFASYADFFDSIELVKQHCSRLLAALEGKYGRRFNVAVAAEFPRLRDPYDYAFRGRPWQGLLPVTMRPLESAWGGGRSQRDAFFWFLLILCVTLLVVVGALVYGAVVRTYFS